MTVRSIHTLPTVIDLHVFSNLLLLNAAQGSHHPASCYSAVFAAAYCEPSFS